jgi:hypothetical protein
MELMQNDSYDYEGPIMAAVAAVVVFRLEVKSSAAEQTQWHSFETQLFDHQSGQFQSHKKSGIHPTYRATRSQSLGF